MLCKYLNRLNQLDALLRHKATGTPAQLAQKLGISLRAWHELRNQLIEDLDVPIAYCPHRKSYYYAQDGQFVVGFKPLSEERKTSTQAGNLLNRKQEFFIFSKNFYPSAFSLHSPLFI